MPEMCVAQKSIAYDNAIDLVEKAPPKSGAKAKSQPGRSQSRPPVKGKRADAKKPEKGKARGERKDERPKKRTKATEPNIEKACGLMKKREHLCRTLGLQGIDGSLLPTRCDPGYHHTWKQHVDNPDVSLDNLLDEKVTPEDAYNPPPACQLAQQWCQAPSHPIRLRSNPDRLRKVKPRLQGLKRTA